MACAGSDPCYYPPHVPGFNSSLQWCKPSWGMGGLQGARFESLDNSPMYDDPGGGYNFWDSATHRMQLYDVGQTAAMVGEAKALATLATLLGHDDDAAMLRSRAANLSALVQEHMWLPSASVYSNVLANGTVYKRISPTSFIPLLAGIASHEQAQATTAAWLTNGSRFCVPADAAHWPPPAGPSVSDPASGNHAMLCMLCGHIMVTCSSS